MNCQDGIVDPQRAPSIRARRPGRSWSIGWILPYFCRRSEASVYGRGLFHESGRDERNICELMCLLPVSWFSFCRIHGTLYPT